MNIDKNASLLIKSQLPDYITTDPNYSNFWLFLNAYYEWMEQSSSANNTNVLYNSKNILNYIDVDKTTSTFLDFFVNDFLQYFPKGTLIRKSLALRAAKELYKSKGTPSSYKFLFRVLYNSDCEIFYTQDSVFKASDGSWYITKSLKLSSSALGFLNIQNKRIFGESTKSIATIETSVASGTKTEVFISNIERLFKTGEMVRVVDNNNQDVYYSVTGEEVPVGTPGATILRAKIVGQINQINIDPKNRGLYYLKGDPIVFHDGFDLSIQNPVGATAEVGTVTTGSIQSINVLNGGFGYSQNSIISLTNAPGALASIPVTGYTSTIPPQYIITNSGSGYLVGDIVINGTLSSSSYITFADVTSVDSSGRITGIRYRSGLSFSSIFGITANVVSSNTLASSAKIQISTQLGNGTSQATYIVKDSIILKANTQIGSISYNFANFSSANANTKLINAFTFESFQTYAISSVNVDNGGLNIQTLPTVTGSSLYIQDNYNNIGQPVYGDLSRIGILSPIQIIQPGNGYVANDKIVFTGGSGYGAYANVASVDSSGGITSINYVYPISEKYPLGGMGYRADSLPTLSVTSSGGSGASLYVPGILGTGATFSPTLDDVGSIQNINILTYGEDYSSAPSLSLAVQDIVVTNVLVKPSQGDIIYQGVSFAEATFFAVVDSITNLDYNSNPASVNYNLRVYDYNKQPDKTFPFKVNNSSITFNMAGFQYTDNLYYPNLPDYDINGVKQYGNGKAKATATFLNGLTVSKGQYLNSKGQPSSSSVLQNEIYNNFTYQVTVEKEISKYRNILLNLLHPTGTKMIGRYAIKSTESLSISGDSYVSTGKHL